LRALKGARYLTEANADLAKFITENLAYLDFSQWHDFIQETEPKLDDAARALLNANDRFYLLTVTLHRRDAWHSWLYDRCREVEAQPDGRLDLWARYHYKSSIGTFAGIIQEVIIDPEITVAILSCTGDVAKPFLVQIQQEMEANEDLKRIHGDVFWKQPRKEAPRWSREEGLVVKRKGNPKEATIEAHGIIDAMPTGKHFNLLDYDDLVTEKLIGNPEMIKKVTERWELSDNLGQMSGTRKWHWGTRYSFGDSYGIMLERKTLKERRYPATHDGTLKGQPVLMTAKRWAEVKLTQRSTVSAQMLLNPTASNEATLTATSFRHYEVMPSVMNVYIMCDPSKGRTQRSDRTAIAVIGVDQGGNKYLLDGYRHRMKLSERWTRIKQLEAKWQNHPGVQMVRVGYEQYGMQSDIEVIKELQEKEGRQFAIDELGSTKDGKHGKNDRIDRLEPDMGKGLFHLPAVVYHPDYGGLKGQSSLWEVWNAEDQKLAEEAGQRDNPAVGTIIYRPMQDFTKAQRAVQAAGARHRVVIALKRRDENGDLYDLTRAFIEEAVFHPFAPHDDLIDACSRIYDMEPKAPIMFEAKAAEARAYPDS
jgi:hypothetical protein